MFFTEKIDCLKKRKEIFGVVLLVILLIIVGSNKAYAAEATVNFDEDNYSIEKDTNFEVNVSIQADGNIGLYNVSLRYDTDRMEYVSGAEKEEGGIITLEGTGFGNEISYTLEFKAVGAGDAGIKVKDVHINSADDEAIHYTISSFATAPINIEGQETGEKSFFEQLLEEEQAQVSGNIDSIDTDVPIVGSITNSDGNILYVIDLTDYEPDINVWNYKKITINYNEKNITLLTNQEKQISAALLVDETGDFTLYALKNGSKEFYPISTMFIDGSEYYVVSALACSEIPSEMDMKEVQDGVVFYAMDEMGKGGFYKYSSNKGLIEWNSEEETKSIVVVSDSWIVVGFGLILLLVLIVLIIVYEKQSNGSFKMKQYMFVISQLTSREIKRKYARSFLGIAWSVLNPLLYMTVMSVIFSSMFKSSIEKFPTYFLTAYIFWNLFSVSTTTAMTALVDNRNLLQKAKLPREIFVLSRVYTALVNFGFSCVAYILVLLVFRIEIKASALFIIVDIFFAFLFSIGISFILATIFVSHRDIKFIYSNFMVLLDHLIAMYYPIEMLTGGMRKIVEWNPIYWYVRVARDCVLYGKISDNAILLRAIFGGIGSFLVGVLIFKINENKIIQKL